MSPEALIVIGVSSLVTLICSTAAESSRTGRRLERATVRQPPPQDHTRHAEDDQDQPQRAQDVIGRLQRAAQHQRVVPQIGDRHCDDAVLLTSGRHTRPGRVAALQPGDGELLRAQHQVIPFVGDIEGLAVGPDRSDADIAGPQRTLGETPRVRMSWATGTAASEVAISTSSSSSAL